MVSVPSLELMKELLKSRTIRFLRDLRGFRIRDLTPVEVSFVNNDDEARINLVALGIGSREAYGGTPTVIRFMRAIMPYFPRARVIVLNEYERDFEKAAWPEWQLASEQPEARRTVAFATTPRYRVDVGPNDYFIATHWLTAHYLTTMREIQLRVAEFLPHSYVYLIQDFEPAFYPWSARYLLAEATYRRSHTNIAVFNTQLLREYFEMTGYRFPITYHFEPRMNPILAAHRRRLIDHRKRRLLLVYGRPQAARNAFELVVETLFQWSRRFEWANRWQVVSLGARHKDVRLSRGVVLRSKGKVSLDEYATYLLDASVGLSLMVSPHPSYPPLEMADFGIQVVTNNFANKDLSTRSRNITSLSDPSPDSLAEVLQARCAAFDDVSAGSLKEQGPMAFLGGEDEFPFIANLARRITDAN